MWLCCNDILSLPHNAHLPIISFLDIRSSPFGNNGVSGLEPKALIIKFEFLICNRVSLPDKCKDLTPRMPRPPIEFVISIKLITPTIAKLNRETMSVFTLIGMLNSIAENTKIIFLNYYIISL